MKTGELTGYALDWAIAKCERVINGDDLDVGFILERGYTPSTNWAQGGAIIERECIAVWFGVDGEWNSQRGDTSAIQTADTPLVAAMRCYVASKLGDEVEVPVELTNKGEAQ